MTYIYKELSTNQVADVLRADEYAGWSYRGAMALAEYLEQMAEDCGEPIKLDTVALRCEFREYRQEDMQMTPAREVCADYGFSPKAEDYGDEEDHEQACLEWLQRNTQVIEFDGGLIVQEF